MNILKKRPLSLILCIMLGGFSLFIDFSIQVKLISAFCCLAIIAIIIIMRNKIQGRTCITLAVLLSLSLSLFLSALWSHLFFPARWYGETVTVKGRIRDIEHTQSSTCVLTIDTVNIDGKSASHRLIVYAYAEDVSSMNSSDIISFTASITPFSSDENGFDSKSYYISGGYSALATKATDFALLDNVSAPLGAFFEKTAQKVSNTLKLRTDYKTGALLSALITGDRSDLDGNTRLNFARIGISHILALSGMHLAILSAAVNRLLTFVGIDKKKRTPIVIFLTLFYMALTGFSSSVMRAGIMLIITGLLYMISHKSDHITSLLISVAVILIITPYAVYDLSLWLSAFATLGVIVFSELQLYEKDKACSIAKRFLFALFDGCLVSLFAFGATFAICALRFDSFSVISIFTTIIFAPLVELLIYGGLLLLILGGIIPFGNLIIIIADLIKLLAEAISSAEWVHVSMNSFAVKLSVVIFAVFFFAFLLLDTGKKKQFVVIISSLLLSTFIIAEAAALLKDYDDEIIYSAHPTGDCFLIKNSGETSLVYSGKQFLEGAFEINDLLSDSSVTYVDNILLANYSYSTIDFCAALISSTKTERIYIPRPITDYEVSQAEVLSDFLSIYGT